MRPAALFAIAVMAVLTVSSLFGPGIGLTRAEPSAAGAHPAVPALTISTTGSTGGGRTLYEPVSNSNGQVYFIATDLNSGTDKHATVQIFDKNASRDGLPSPAWTTTVGFPAGNTNYSYLAGVSYQIPFTLPYGGEWNITLSSPSGFAWADFNVSVYEAYLNLQPRSLLPAQNASASWYIYDYSNEVGYTHLTSLTLTGTYQTSTTTKVLPNTPAKLSTNPVGWWNFTVPTDAAGLIAIELYANVSSNGNRSVLSGASAEVGGLGSPTVSLNSCPELNCASYAFASGTPVYVSVGVRITLGGGPAEGMTVAFKFLHGASFVTAPGNPPATVTTDANGDASISFLAATSVFPTNGINTVSVTVSDPNDPSVTSETTNATFVTYNTTLRPTLTALFSSSEYYSGSTATLQWTLGGLNASAVKGWSGSLYEIVEYGAGSIVTLGTLPNSTATSGSVPFAIPADFTGELEGVVVAANTSAEVEAIALTNVVIGQVLLTPSEMRYAPGDTVTIGVSVEGSALSSASLWAVVNDSAGNIVYNGAVSGDHVTINVPSSSPPTSYSVDVSAKSTSGGTLVGASVMITETEAVVLSMGVQTASNYVDGSFQSGETVTVSYTFTAIGNTPLTPAYTILLSPSSTNSSGLATQTVALSGSSGTFQFTIPSSTPNGVLMVFGAANLVGANCYNICSTSGSFSLLVNNHPASLSYQFGNSGFTVGALILIIVLLVVAVLALFMLRHRGRPMMMKPESSSASSTSSSGSPAAPSGGSPPPTGSS